MECASKKSRIDKKIKLLLALKGQMRYKGVKLPGQEEPDSKVLESRLLIMPEEEAVISYDSNVLFDLYRHYCLAADYAGDGIYRIMSNK